jgi:hypothetical protein
MATLPGYARAHTAKLITSARSALICLGADTAWAGPAAPLMLLFRFFLRNVHRATVIRYSDDP